MLSRDAAEGHQRFAAFDRAAFLAGWPLSANSRRFADGLRIAQERTQDAISPMLKSEEIVIALRTRWPSGITLPSRWHRRAGAQPPLHRSFFTRNALKLLGDDLLLPRP